MTKPIIKQGDQYGRLTAVELHHRGERGHQFWMFSCSCGSSKVIALKNVRTKYQPTKSCGCLQVEASKAGGSARTHGFTGTPVYRIWKAMRTRTNNPHTKDARNYSDRGITTCPEWGDFLVFLSDMGNRPSDNHTLERINNSLGYSAENCVWATRKEQMNNTRHNRMLTLDGVTKTMMEWSECLPIGYSCIRNRLCRGWSDERALTEPVRGHDSSTHIDPT